MEVDNRNVHIYRFLPDDELVLVVEVDGGHDGDAAVILYHLHVVRRDVHVVEVAARGIVERRPHLVVGVLHVIFLPNRNVKYGLLVIS